MPPPLSSNNPQLNATNSIKKGIFSTSLCIALIGLSFMPVAEAKSICHTEVIKLTFCPKKEDNSLRVPSLLRCRATAQKVEVCRRFMEPMPHKFFDLSGFLEKNREQALRDETIFIGTAEFKKIENDANFREVRLNRAELEKAAKLEKLELQQQKIDAVEKPIREMKK